jgi:acyl-CoA thioester hydrolase
MSLTSESRVRVRYAETDQMGVVYHANYLVWFEVGRVDLIRSLGLDYKSMEQQEGVGIAVVEAVVRYKAPARYDDELIVRTTLAHTRGSIVAFDYKLHRAEDDLLLAEGSTTHIVVDRDMKRAAMPERFAHAFSAPSSAQPHRA